LTAIIPHLYQIVLPTPFPVGPVNVYLAHDETEPLTLIDVGPRTADARAALEAGLAQLGYTLADIGRIIVTHAHADHHGLAGDVVQACGAEVYAHPHNQATLTDYVSERAQRRAFYEQMLIEAGVPPEVRASIGEMTRGYGRFATSVPAVRPLDEGDELTLAGYTWQVYAMPGHTGGLLCFYQPETRLFLSNDHLLRDISSNPMFEPPMPGQTQRRRSLVDYIASLERTAALDIAVTWPGHGEPIYDHRALIAQRLAFHRRRAEKMLAALDNGPQTAFTLSQAIFAKLEPTERFLAISEILAHLEWLEEQGEVTVQRQDVRVFWGRQT